MADTIAMADNSTRAMGMEESHRLLLRKDVVFEGKNDSYEIKATDRIGSGGESQVYLAKRKSDGEQVVAKIYDEYADTPASRRNRKRIIDFLVKNSDYKQTHIMPLLDHGNISMESEDGEDFLKPIDIIPYCKDGELKQCGYKILKDKVIPEILQALNSLHTSNLVHRDIKPNNIYMLNGDVVIADFGTSGEISSNDKYDYIGTQKKRGTVGYTAPEVWQGYAVVSSDYYSFGCTIATLYKGEHVYKNLFNDDTKLIRAINNNGLPLHCLDTETDLQILVDALVRMAENDRAGYDDIKNWIKDSKSFVNKWKNKQRQNDEAPLLEFNFEGKICNNEAELTDAMLKQWDNAKRYLYRGIIADFFKQKNPTLADKTINIVESKETAMNQDLGLARFLHYLNQAECPIYWGGQTYKNLSEISKAIANKEADEKSITAMLTSEFLSWKFSNTKEVANQATIDVIKDVECIAKEYAQLGYYTAMHRFTASADKERTTPDAIFKEKIGDDWYKTAKESVNDDIMLSKLIDLKGREPVLNFKKECTGIFVSDDRVSDLELLYMLFEGICEDKISVREHYLRYGPHAYLYWLQQNLNLYSFNSSRAKGIESQIKNIKIDKNMSVSKNRSCLTSLRTILLNEFMKLLQNNYLLTYIGLRTEADTEGITTQYTHAFFAGNFFGINVPVGYLKNINYKTGGSYE